MEKINCPNCEYEMLQVEIQSHHGLKKYFLNISAIVSTADDGGSFWFY